MYFPQYRKYKNDRSFFRIISPEELEELKLTGSYYEVHPLKAKIHPDRVFIKDLLHHYDAHCEVITAAEYEEKLNWCKTNLKLLGHK